MKIKIKKIQPEAIVPSYAHPGDAGLDLYSLEDKVLLPGERYLFALGIQLEVPEGYVSLIWDKSGLAAKQGLHSLGGVVDSGYRGEIKVTLVNLGSEDYEIKKGDKIAQLLIQPVVSAEVEEVEDLSETSRGEGSFGSTGR